MILNKKFQRKIENFVCQHCGQTVKGNGYTNHCPSCLYSRHVDDNPGDRANGCRGMMSPLASEPTRDGFNIIHQCELCGAVTKTKAAQDDNKDLLIKLSQETY